MVEIHQVIMEQNHILLWPCLLPLLLWPWSCCYKASLSFPLQSYSLPFDLPFDLWSHQDFDGNAKLPIMYTFIPILE